MASRDYGALNTRRAVWGGSLVALALAVVIGWALNQQSAAQSPAAASAEPASTPASSLLPAPALDRTAASEGATAAASSPPAAHPPLDELRDVRLALEGKASPQDTLKAATVLMSCKGADGTVETMYRMRDQGDPGWKALEKLPGARMDELIARAQDVQRRCQVFDSSTLARTGELLARAYEGGAKEAALPYLQWLNGEGRQTGRPEAIGKLQRETRQAAEDGDVAALTVYSHAFNSSAFGITVVQRQAYKEAWLRIQGESAGAAMEKASRDSMENLERMVRQQALSAEQQREADALTERVVAAWRKRKT